MQASTRATLLIVALTAGPAHGMADTIFHVVEVLSEQEVSPRQARHVTRWEGDYYVTDTDVSVLGWGAKGGGEPIPFDQPHHGVALGGGPYVSVFHRLPDGIEVVIDFDTYVIDRKVVRTGPQSCRLSATQTLKPGHSLYEVHRVSNHELMYDSDRHFTALVCSLPKLVG